MPWKGPYDRPLNSRKKRGGTTIITIFPPAGRALENANPAWETIPLTDGRKGDPQLYVEGKIRKNTISRIWIGLIG